MEPPHGHPRHVRAGHLPLRAHCQRRLCVDRRPSHGDDLRGRQRHQGELAPRLIGRGSRPGSPPRADAVHGSQAGLRAHGHAAWCRLGHHRPTSPDEAHQWPGSSRPAIWSALSRSASGSVSHGPSSSTAGHGATPTSRSRPPSWTIGKVWAWPDIERWALAKDKPWGYRRRGG